MSKMTKLLLGVSLAAFALGFTDILWGFGKPVGAICFGLFLIFNMLGKEAALYDEEQALRSEEATRISESTKSAPIETRGVRLKTVVAHGR